MDDNGYPSCMFVDPAVVTCYPTNQTVVYQNQYTRAIWNTQYAPFFTNDAGGLVDLYLRNAETDKAMGKWNATRQSGTLKLLVDDSWWDNRAVDQWTGQVRNWTFYWVIVPGGTVLNGGEAHQPTFTVLQTALPNYAISSSASMNSASRSPAEESTASLSKEQSSGGNGFPTWAIALVVVLGVVTLTCILSLVFVLRRYSRRKQHREDRRNLMGRESPIMVVPTAGTPSPMTAAPTAGALSPMMAVPTAGALSPMMAAPIVDPPPPMMTAPTAGPSSPLMVAPTTGPASPLMVTPTAGPSPPIAH